MRATMTLLKRFAVLLGVWLILTANAPSAWLVGLATAAAGAALSLRLLPAGTMQIQLGGLFALLPGFLWGSFRGGLDVAWRAFNPRLPLRPGWIRYPLRLPGGAARVSLGNLLSLMPGTLGAGCGRDRLYVHCLDTDQPVAQLIAAEEQRIAQSLGIELESAHE